MANVSQKIIPVGRATFFATAKKIMAGVWTTCRKSELWSDPLWCSTQWFQLQVPMVSRGENWQTPRNICRFGISPSASQKASKCTSPEKQKLLRITWKDKHGGPLAAMLAIPKKMACFMHVVYYGLIHMANFDNTLHETPIGPPTFTFRVVLLWGRSRVKSIRVAWRHSFCFFNNHGPVNGIWFVGEES